MKKKTAALLLGAAAVLACAQAVPAEETETEVVAEAAEGTPETEAQPRPDYKASDYVTLGDYTGLSVTVDTSVSELEIDARVRTNLQMAGLESEELTEGTVQSGDVANIDYVGKKDDVAFEGGTAEGFDLEIGSNTFIEGFEDGLIGVAIGETVDLPLTFPENYHAEDLAGADVVFTVTVNSVKRPQELTDDLVSELTDGAVTSVAAYRSQVMDELIQEKKVNIDNTANAYIYQLITQNSTIDGYPEDVISYDAQMMKDYYEEYAAEYGMEFSDFLASFLGMTQEQFEAETITYAQSAIAQELYMNAIAEVESLELTDEEYAERGAAFAKDYGYETLEELEAAYGADAVRTAIQQDKVMEFLRENNEIIEQTGDEAETETESETETGVIE